MSDWFPRRRTPKLYVCVLYDNKIGLREWQIQRVLDNAIVAHIHHDFEPLAIAFTALLNAMPALHAPEAK